MFNITPAFAWGVHRRGAVNAVHLPGTKTPPPGMHTPKPQNIVLLSIHNYGQRAICYDDVAVLRSTDKDCVERTRTHAHARAHTAPGAQVWQSCAVTS